ncbi:hypothetical protein FALBO_12966 [Fusarium albosuccineum]|uniref:Uncharacterized protein n=1 Tax=Fusarium albosuccineum TaxID=1237068 RepID=A0A8H4L0V5_9HYPO|nr:hypothetical protein FALBO_12966 [Fusarium albosuccineum]
MKGRDENDDLKSTIYHGWNRFLNIIPGGIKDSSNYYQWEDDNGDPLLTLFSQSRVEDYLKFGTLKRTQQTTETLSKHEGSRASETPFHFANERGLLDLTPLGYRNVELETALLLA